MARISTRRAVLRRLAVFLMALPITSCATPMSLHEAVARGKVSRIDMCMKRGCVGPAILALLTIARNTLPLKLLCCFLYPKEAE